MPVATWRSPHATPLSTRFPLDEYPTAGVSLKNWLLGLLPDNDRVLLALQHRHDIARSNRLDLLGTAIGEECAGAVQFCWRSRTEGLLNKEGGMTPISDDEVIAWLNELRDDPAYRPGDHEGRGGFSLAGMQPKIALRETSTGWAVPWGHEPTSHILKIARPQRFPHECVMEHITMGIANRLGISTASTELLVEDDLEAIVVKRYDRVSDNEGRLLRVHQEDFCQALGYPPDRKYQDEDGPTPTDIADMLQQTAPSPSNAETAVRRFRDMHIFQWLTVAIDAHSKNYSLLLSGDQTAVAAVVRHLLLVAVPRCRQHPQVASRHEVRPCLSDRQRRPRQRNTAHSRQPQTAVSRNRSTMRRTSTASAWRCPRYHRRTPRRVPEPPNRGALRNRPNRTRHPLPKHRCRSDSESPQRTENAADARLRNHVTYPAKRAPRHHEYTDVTFKTLGANVSGAATVSSSPRA